MKIIVDRNSVCAGDDVYNHEMTFEVPESLTVAEFFDLVEVHGFLAAIVGNDVAWGLQNRTGKIGEYFTKTGEVTHPEVSIKDKMVKQVGTLISLCATIAIPNGPEKTVMEDKHET